MIEVAGLHEQALKIELAKAAYDLKYQYHLGCYANEYVALTDNYNQHEFAVLDTDRKVIGYINYSINRAAWNVTSLGAINFSDNKILFGRALYQVIDDIFYKYKFNKIEYGAYTANPIIGTYDRLTAKCGGRVVGIKTKSEKLMDGKLYDFKMYELMAKDYKPLRRAKRA